MTAQMNNTFITKRARLSPNLTTCNFLLFLEQLSKIKFCLLLDIVSTYTSKRRKNKQPKLHRQRGLKETFYLWVFLNYLIQTNYLVQ